MFQAGPVWNSRQFLDFGYPGHPFGFWLNIICLWVGASPGARPLLEVGDKKLEVSGRRKSGFGIQWILSHYRINIQHFHHMLDSVHYAGGIRSSKK